MRCAGSAVIRIVAGLLLALWMPAAARAETPIPPSPSMWVTDKAGYLSPQTVSDLNARLSAYEHQTGHQILVYVAPTTGGVPIEDWAVRAFAQWKVGRKGLDDGLVLFIFPKDRMLRIEVGYGLEPKVTDLAASRIIRDTIAPALKAGQPDRGVTEGVDQIIALAGGAVAAGATASPTQAADSTPITPLELVIIGLVLLVIVIIAIRNPWFAVSLIVNIASSRGGGSSGGGGGGGFSGGGGRSGGGGASGSW